jgi:hypothetical protein
VSDLQLLQITRTKNLRDLHLMKTNQLGCSIMKMFVRSTCHTAQVKGDPQEQEEGDTTTYREVVQQI